MNIDKKEFSETKENNWQVLISVVISIVITLIGLWGSLETRSTCLVFGVAAIMLLITGRLVKNKYPEECKNIVSSAISILIVSLIAYFTIDSTQLEGSLWYQTLRDSEDEEILTLINKADNGGDGLAQAELSDYYHSKKDYPKARLYATKASNNWNARAFYRLAEYDINGLGCEVDIRDGINHFINALRLERFDYSNFLNELSQKEKDLSPTDSMRLALFLQSHEYVDSIIMNSFSLLAGVKDPIERRNKVNHNITLLNYASLSGFRNATVVLYSRVATAEKSAEAHRLAEMLYNVAYIPTNTFERFTFFRSYYQEDRYDTENYKRYIKDNEYSLLLMGDKILNHFSLESYDLFSYQTAINEYALFRSQYQWIKNRNNGIIFSVNYYLTDDSQRAAEEERVAWELLRNNIMAIQNKMNNPTAWDESNKTRDFIKSHGIMMDISFN